MPNDSTGRRNLTDREKRCCMYACSTEIMSDVKTLLLQATAGNDVIDGNPFRFKRIYHPLVVSCRTINPEIDLSLTRCRCYSKRYAELVRCTSSRRRSLSKRQNCEPMTKGKPLKFSEA